MILDSKGKPLTEVSMSDKPVLFKDLPFVEEQDFGGETTIIKSAAEFNAPLRGSKTIIIPVAQIGYYQKKVKENPDYFKNLQVRFLKVLKDADFVRFMQTKLQIQGAGKLPDSDIIKSAGLTVHQNLQTY